MKILKEKFEKDLENAIYNGVENLKWSLDNLEEGENAVEVGCFPLDNWVDSLNIKDYVEATEEELEELEDLENYEILEKLKLEYNLNDVFVEFEEYLKENNIKFERCEGEFYAFEGKFHNISSECLVYIYSI